MARVSEDQHVSNLKKLMSDSSMATSNKMARNRAIRDLIEDGMNIYSPSGMLAIASKTLQQALWRTMSRTKPLDYKIEIIPNTQKEKNPNGTDPVADNSNYEAIINAAVSQIMNSGGYNQSLRDKNGAFFSMYLYGDGFIQIGANPEEGTTAPIVFNPIDNSNVYVDPFAQSIVANGGRGARRLSVVYAYAHATAKSLYPKIKGDEPLGCIPRDNSDEEITRNNYTNKTQEDKTEIAHYWDLDTKTYMICAGQGMQVLSIKKGESYPFVKGGEAYIPVLQYICQPSISTFTNWGLGDMLYDLSIIHNRLLNMGVAHISDNVYPLQLINVPNGTEGELFGKLSQAYRLQASGRRGVVAMGYDPNDPNGGRVSSETLQTQSMINEWDIVLNKLNTEIRRLGINLDEADRGSNVTATQILAEEESSTSFIKQGMEYNATTTQQAVEIVIDAIKEFVEDGDLTPVHLSVAITTVDGLDANGAGVTMGGIAQYLRNNDTFVKVNARTGSIPSNIADQARTRTVLASTPPNTKAYFKLQEKLARYNDQDLSMEDFGYESQEMQALAAAPKQTDEPAPASDTDRLTINPRTKIQEPIL